MHVALQGATTDVWPMTVCCKGAPQCSILATTATAMQACDMHCSLQRLGLLTLYSSMHGCNMQADQTSLEILSKTKYQRFPEASIDMQLSAVYICD